MLTQAQRSGSDVIAGTLFLLKHLVQVDSGLEKLGRLSCKAKYASVVDTDPTLNMKTDIYNPALPVFISRVKKKKKKQQKSVTSWQAQLKPHSSSESGHKPTCALK